MSHRNVFIVLLLVLISCNLFSQNGALYFNASTPDNDYVSFGTNQYNQLFSGLSGYTFEGWINATSLASGTGRNRIINIQINSGAVSLFMGLTQSGKIEIGARSGNSDSYQSAISANAVITTGTWHHVAAVVNFATGSKSIRGYVDGVQVASNTSPTFANTTFVPGPGALENLGIHPSSLPTFADQFIGYMDEFRIWNYARTASEVSEGMYIKLTGTETGIIGLWHFDETSGTTADDASASNKNGTLINFPADPWEDGVENLSPVPTTQASGLNATNIGVNSLTVNWDNGNGARRIVVMNTENTFTNPVNGTDPSANSVWQNSGQQVIYNGTGGSVPISGLDPGTKYWFRVYEYNGTGIYTVYLKTTAVNNPIESDETLPIELSSFTANFTVNNLVVLHWITQSETECQGYYILRNTSIDLSSAQIISQLIPAHNTSDQQVYTYNDTEVFESGMYYYWLQDMDFNGGYSYHGPLTVNVGYTPGDDPIPGIPFVAGIKKIYPNPATINTIIKYGVEESNEVQFEIYNSKGQLVRSFNQGIKDQGDFSLIWNGKDSKGSLCPSGIYLVRMQAGKLVSSSKLMLVR